ncbi:SDR family oxidoreductase [Candidatus Hydrogenedentota bacterium]
MSVFVVTGGAGFIGSNITEALCARGDSIVVLDDFSSGKRKNLDNINGDVSVIEGSITDLEVCRQAVEGADYVLHHAAQPSVPGSVADPVGTNNANLTGAINMLVAARDANIKRFVLAASSAAYGDSPQQPKREDMYPTPLSPYAVQKVACEMYCAAFYQLYGLETVSFRYFNVFGPRQDPNSQYAAVVPKFITACLEGRSPIIFGNGEQTRDFVHIGDIVRANLAACDAPEKALGQVFNIGSGERITINDLAGAIKAVVGSDIEISYQDARPGDVMHSQADTTKAKTLLGFTPSISLREGIEMTVERYR